MAETMVDQEILALRLCWQREIDAHAHTRARLHHAEVELHGERSRRVEAYQEIERLLAVGYANGVT